MRKTIGIILIIFVLIVLFVGTAFSMGIINALITWGIAIGLTALICFAGYLIDTSEE